MHHPENHISWLGFTARQVLVKERNMCRSVKEHICLTGYILLQAAFIQLNNIDTDLWNISIKRISTTCAFPDAGISFFLPLLNTVQKVCQRYEAKKQKLPEIQAAFLCRARSVLLFLINWLTRFSLSSRCNLAGILKTLPNSVSTP